MRAFFFPTGIVSLLKDAAQRNQIMRHFYLNPKQDDYNKIPELQVCIAEALYDIEPILSDPSALPKDEVRALRDQVASNLERAWELTGGSEDTLTGTMLLILQVMRKENGTFSFLEKGFMSHKK